MKQTGRWSVFQELEDSPETPFLNDLEKDLENINKSFSEKEAKEIKLKLIDRILKNL